MKFLKTLFTLTLFLSVVGSAQAQGVDLTFGSKFDTTLSLFTNEAKTGFDGTTQGLMAFGYFADGFDVSAEAASLNDTNFSTFITNFTVLAESNFDAVGSSSGFLTQSSNFDDSSVTGKTPYLLTLSGVTSFASASSATEIGLFRDTAFGTIPAPGDPIPTEYATESVTYDSVVLGAEYLNETLSGAFTGFSGNLYATQTIAAAVPEPSTYALLLGALSFGFVYYRRKVAPKKGQQDAPDAEVAA